MTFIFTALLYLGLNLGQETSVLAGNPSKPTLSVQSGPVVARGKQVTISCKVTTGAREYRLYKEGGPLPWRTQNKLEATNEAEFLIPSMEQQYGGRYRCYYKTPAGWSEHSDPLELVVTGLYSKPSLSVQPSAVVTSGETVTLQCGSQLRFSRFVLTKEGDQKPSLILDSMLINSTGQFQGLFLVGPVTPSQRWIFRCYGYYVISPQVWSEPSDPLEIYVSGLTLGLRSPVLAGDPYSKPRLSAVDSPVVNAGETVTLQCISWQRYDGFILIKEGEPKFSRTLDSQYIFTGHLQAMFPVGPMTLSDRGTFRCYGYYKKDPQKWSMPSDPLEIHISGASEMTNSSKVKIASPPQNHTVENLIRMAMVGLVFLVFGILQFKTWYSHRRI